MASVTSTSTREEVRAAMADNASYDEDNSLPKAKAFATACIVWLTCFAFKESKNGQSDLMMSPELIQEQLASAQSWIASQPAPRSTNSGNVSLLSVRNFRR